MNSDGVIYFDNAAATPIGEKYLDFYRACFEEYYCNQEAAHEQARKAREVIEASSKKILRAVCGTDTGYILWDNCGSSALDAIISMPCLADKKIIATMAEHSCIDAALKRRGENKNVFVPINSDGQINIENLEKFLDAETGLVIVHHVQSETGAVQDLGKIRSVIDRNAPNAKLLVDSIQAIGKIPFSYKDIRPDFIVISGRKIGAPGAAAVVYNDEKCNLYFKRLRHTEHQLCRIEPAACITLAECIEDLYSDFSSRHEKIITLNQKLRTALGNIVINGKKPVQFTIAEDKASPFILHFTVHHFQGAILLRMFSQQNIMLAAGSACDAETKNPSKVLLGMGIKRDRAFSALRLSLWDNNTERDCVIFIEKFSEILKNY